MESNRTFEEDDMAELREKVDENPQRRALMDTLDRIRGRAQSQFANPLTIEHYQPDPREWFPGHHPFFFIAEVRTKYWLGIIPRKQRWNLFAIYPGFAGSAYGLREIDCAVYNRSLLEIVREEVQKYADAFQATTINLKQDFVC